MSSLSLFRPTRTPYSVLFVLMALSVCSLVASEEARGSYCEEMYERCQFRIGRTTKIQKFRLPMHQSQLSQRRIISKVYGVKIGLIVSDGLSAEFLSDEDQTATPIDEFGDPKLSPVHFQTLSINNRPRSGIDHIELASTQVDVAKNRCVRLHFSSFDVIKENGQTEHITISGKDEEHCVVFRTY